MDGVLSCLEQHETIQHPLRSSFLCHLSCEILFFLQFIIISTFFVYTTTVRSFCTYNITLLLPLCWRDWKLKYLTTLSLLRSLSVAHKFFSVLNWSYWHSTWCVKSTHTFYLTLVSWIQYVNQHYVNNQNLINRWDLMRVYTVIFVSIHLTINQVLMLEHS